MSTISDLITAAIAGAETNTEISYSEESVEAVSSFDVGDSDAEKIASALEYIAERGVESFIVKEANEKMTHHSGLASNEAAIALKPEARNKMIDPVLAQYYDNAKGDNIHRKKIVTSGVSKHANEKTKKELIKEALAARLAEGGKND